MEEREIVERLKQGDRDALGELYAIYGNKALRTAYLICSDRFLAEDVVSEVFICVYKNIGKLKETEHFRGWFFRILGRAAVKICKREGRVKPTEDIGVILDRGGGVRDEYFAAERFKELYGEIERLSPKLRAVIVLYYFNDMSIREIAQSLGLFEGTVKSRLYRAKKELKAGLSEGGFEYDR